MSLSWRNGMNGFTFSVDVWDVIDTVNPQIGPLKKPPQISSIFEKVPILELQIVNKPHSNKPSYLTMTKTLIKTNGSI